MKFSDTMKTKFGRRLVAPVLAIAMAAGFGAYKAVRPALAAVAGPTAAPLDNDSVSALLSLDRAMEAVSSRVTPAVVNVAVTARTQGNQQFLGRSDDSNDEMQQFFGQFFGAPGRGGRQFRMVPQQPQIEHGVGSGVVISPDGYIVTNNHVVENATDIKVTFSDRRVVSAKLIGTDPLTDLAVIKVSGTNLPNAPWGDSSSLKTGQTVLAFGNPYGMRFTVTRGIVSGLNRTNPYSDDPRKPGDFIQTDAAINPGNSGGPLVNARGEVVGINTFLISPSGTFSGMGFAIPTRIVKPTVETLIKEGHVDHAYMGVSISDVTPENAHFFQMSNADGAVISDVQPDTPASRAGLKVGDVITAVDGAKVTSAGDLQIAVGEKQPGTKINLSVLRDGKETSIPLTLAKYDNKQQAEAKGTGAEHGKARWGIGVQDLTPDVRQQLQLGSDVRGAVVANVQPGSPADDAGLARGNVILEVNRKPVKSAADVQEALAAVQPGQDALLLVQTNGGNAFRVLHPESK